MKKLTRVMYCITSRSGQYLINLAPDGPVFSPMPSEALITRNAWMESSSAAIRAREIAQQFPGVPLGIGMLEMEGTSPGNWRIISTRTFPFLNTTTPLVR